MTEKLSFDQIILRLLDYWREHQCLVWQPYNVQVGAGTNNPATALRVLGPEPWNIVYVEPSVRPDDGRFGDNPNRMQKYYQLQVILQPDPGDPQQLYLDSLAAIGIDVRRHDIRFVEDNWASPVLGAWGLGWEVWLDGQEVAQFTYFQQAGGINLDPVAVEITYGFERMAIALQGKNSVWDLDYGFGISYADVLLREEIEHCEYYFNVADVDALHGVFDTYEREAHRCVEAGLVIPAHDYNLKCSHLFNVLDTRGAIGVTERADYFRRMRNMARDISHLYVAQREEMGHPFLKVWPVAAPVAAPTPEDRPHPAEARTFVLEIGVEELPVADLDQAIEQLTGSVPAMLAEVRLTYDSVDVQGTPRRLTTTIAGLAHRQPDLESVVKGPPAERAFDADGNPTKAAQGFARGKGVAVTDLEVVAEGDKRYVAAVVREEGRNAVDVLSEALPALIADIKFGRSIRWNQSNVNFSRPLRWLLALFGDVVVPFSYADVHSGRVTVGIRPYGSPRIQVAEAESYASVIADANIILNVAARSDLISQRSAELAAEVDGVIPADPALLAEVTNLVEMPTPFRGNFAEHFLDLPPEALVAVMRKHQRYFPVYDNDGNLLPYFIAVRNGDEAHLDVVTHGNEQVILARFSDAAFFYKNDNKQKLVDFLPRLSTLTFQAKLGSMLDKIRRIEKLVPTIGAMLDLSAAEQADAARAATLMKADLATEMVVEMTSLQGVMGAHYAARDGEPEAVTAAIREQYRAVNSSRIGMAIGLADRLDSLTGLFAAGLAPKGSNDPFALRRAAIHVIENLIVNETKFDLAAAITAAGELLPIESDAASQQGLLSFVTGRLEVVLRDSGATTAVVKAVLAEQANDPFTAHGAALALQAATEAEGWAERLDAYARCVRITRKLEARLPLRPAAFAEEAEQALLAAYQAAAAAKDGSVDRLVSSIEAMKPAITTFFDDLLVMAEDESVRNNRLALLQSIAALATGIADLSQLEGF